MFQDQKDIENRLSALGEHLESLTDEPVELLVCGGSALIVLGFVQRATKDVDILAYVKKTASGDIEFINAKPLDDQLVEAVNAKPLDDQLVEAAGKHFDDLLALKPTADELEEAARWSMTHDESEGYRQVLKDLLNHMGYKDVAERL